MISDDSDLPRASTLVARAAALALIAVACVACLPPQRDTSPLPKDAGGDSGPKDTGPLDLAAVDGGPIADLADDATPADGAVDATPSDDTGIAKDVPVATGAGGCASDGDCAGYVHNSCQAPSKCNADTGICDPPDNLDTGTKCPDNLCIVGGTCDAGVCKGALVDCNDKNDCTADGCNPKKGCFHDTTLTIKCDSKQICAPGKCAAGACVPVPIDCGVGTDPCRKPKCNPTTGLCDQNLPLPDDLNIPCNDPLPCRGPGVCSKGSCKGVNLCDTKNICALDVCLAGKCASYMMPDKDCSESPCKPGKCTDTGNGSLSCVITDKCNDKNPCTFDSCAASTGVCKTMPSLARRPATTATSALAATLASKRSAKRVKSLWFVTMATLAPTTPFAHPAKAARRPTTAPNAPMATAAPATTPARAENALEKRCLVTMAMPAPRTPATQ